MNNWENKNKKKTRRTNKNQHMNYRPNHWQNFKILPDSTFTNGTRKNKTKNKQIRVNFLHNGVAEDGNVLNC
jgi:hypothetical protein